MTEEQMDVNQAPVQEQTPAEVSEDVKTPEVVDRKVYEQVRDDMKAEREAKRTANAKNAELEARIAELESAKGTEDDDDDQGDVRTKAKVEILYLVQSDPFVKDNLDLIEDKMSDNPNMTAQMAIKELKSDFFDKMQTEVSKSEPEKPLKQLNPKGNTTERKNIVQDALDGKVEGADPRQIAAYQATMARLK